MRILPLMASSILVADALIAGRVSPKRAVAECGAGVFIVLRELVEDKLANRHVTSIRKYGSYADGQYVWHEDATVTTDIRTSAQLQEDINSGVSA